MSASHTPPFNDDPRKESLIEYPCDFPIKVMGARVDGFAEAMAAVAQQFDPGFNPATIEMRPSKAGNYLSVTLTIKATSREQLDNIYRALTSHPMVKVAL
jgi:putative lipoic acid-binding regulatory protein